MDEPVRANDEIARVHDRTQKAVFPERYGDSLDIEDPIREVAQIEIFVTAKQFANVSGVTPGFQVIERNDLKRRRVDSTVAERRPKIHSKLETMNLRVEMQRERFLRILIRSVSANTACCCIFFEIQLSRKKRA